MPCPFFFSLTMNQNEYKLIGTPSFKGRQGNPVSIEQVRDTIKNQKRIKGFRFAAPAGNSEQNIDLTGTARMFLGLAFVSAKPESVPNTQFQFVSSVQLIINNEIVIDQVSPNFLTNFFTNQEYYFLPRPLNGKDDIVLKFKNTGAETENIDVVVYYI